MAQVTLPYTLTAGTPENVNNLVSNLNALVTGVNTIDTAQIAASSVTSAKIADGTIVAGDLASSVGNFGAWTAFTPTITGSVTNPGISGANAYNSGTYAKIGRVVTGKVKIQWGSTSTAGSGFYTITLPVTARTQSAGEPGQIGVGYIFNGNTNALIPVLVLQNNATTFALYYSTTYNGTSQVVGSADPFAWGANCSFDVHFTYEAAS